MDYDLDYDFMIDDQSCMRSCPPTLFSSLYLLFPIKNGGVSDFGGKMDSIQLVLGSGGERKWHSGGSHGGALSSS